MEETQKPQKAYHAQQRKQEAKAALLGLGNGAFSYCSSLTSIMFGENNQLTSIGSSAFEGCSSLTSIMFGENNQLMSIGSSAFEGCSSLTSIEIPEGVTSIGNNAFSWCSSLTSIEIPDGVTSIGDQAFWGCSSLTSIEIPSGVTSIGGSAFDGCSSLTSIEIPAGVTSIGYRAFSGCSSLTIIEIPRGVTSIGDWAFNGCSSLYQVINHSDLVFTMGSTDNGCVAYYAKVIVDKAGNKIYRDGTTDLTYIDTVDGFRFMIENGEYKLIAYYGEEDTVTLPEDINGNEYTIYQMRGVKNVIIPDSFTTIYDYAFSGCSSLTSIEIPDSVTSIGSSAFYDCSSLTSIKIPDSVTSIGRSAFYGCSSLTSIAIPDSVTSIEYGAFWGCSSLTSIEIPDSVTSIGSSAFYGCSSLTSIEIPDSVTSIGIQAFRGCSSLTSIDIPSGMTSIGTGAFAGCTKLNVSVNDKNESFTAIDGVIYNKAVTKIIFVPESVTSIVIPSTVTDISSAFQGNASIQNVTFEENSKLTSIGYEAFSGCSSLTSIKIPDGVTSIEYEAFSGCSSLTSIEIPDSVTSIAGWAFQNCSSLTSIEIPDGMTSIGYEAFWGCSSLTNINIPESVTSIESGAFGGCSSLTSINIPDGVTSIGDFTFYGCDSLSSIEIPSGVTSIGDWAFYGCDSLSSIEIPSGVTSIGDWAFDGCSKLYQVINYSDLELTIGSEDNGCVAYCAKVVIDKNGNKTYKDEERGPYIETTEGFLFAIENEEYKLIAYLGSENTVTLPEDINGNAYTIYWMSGVKSVIIPDSFTTINDSAFYGCSSLTSVTFGENSQLTRIGYYAFYGCSSLVSIEIPDSVTSIGGSAFNGTAYYNDASNWVDGCLYIGNALIRIDTTAKYVTVKEGTTCIANDAFSGCYSLIQVTLGGNHPSVLSSLTNLETLILTEMPTCDWGNYVYNYFGYSISNIPITLSTIIIKEGAEITNSYAFYGITGVTIYVEANEIDCVWDDTYAGWNNGNKVYYGGEWITAEFYDIDGALIDSSVYLTSQVVRQPYVATTYDDYYTYIVGWDLDGDGFADTVPATSGSNISAHAVVTATERQYTVNFYDKDGVTVLYAYILGYDEPVPVPATPEKQGYTFLGWQGYEEGMTVTGNTAIYSVWEHNGEHNYIKTTVAPTCTEEGYDLYVCEICGESYKENFVEPLGHSFGEWVIETAATCTEDGLRYRVCSTCDETEYEVIEAIGHSYVGVVTKEPNCTEYGEITYTCEHCGDTIVEQLDMTPHNYVKKTVSKSWLRWLIEKLLNIFYGYEGNDAYYYECVDCRHIQTLEEAMLLNASVQGVAHEHVLGEEQLVLAATCEEGIYGRYCTVCGELIEARTVDALGHDYIIIQVVNPTCTEGGYTLHICSRCGDYYATDFVDALGHTPAEAVIENRVEATCTTAGSYDTVIYCEICGEELSRETTVIPATGHSYGETITVAATCTEGGYTYLVCEVCGYEEILTTTEALGHTPAEAVIENRGEATCTTNGSYDTVIYCETCGEELSRETMEIPATGHTPAETVIENRVEVTCTTAGSYETVIYCSICGEELNRDMTVIPATGHTASDWIIDMEATEDSEGERHKECTECGEILDTEIIPKLQKSGVSVGVVIGSTIGGVAVGGGAMALVWFILKRRRL